MYRTLKPAIVLNKLMLARKNGYVLMALRILNIAMPLLNILQAITVTHLQCSRGLCQAHIHQGMFRKDSRLDTAHPNNLDCSAETYHRRYQGIRAPVDRCS